MSRKFNALVFDEYIPSNANATPQITSAALNERLGAFDKLSLAVVTDNVSGSLPTVTVQIFHSPDQRNWKAKNGTAEIPAQTISASGQTMWFGADTNTAGTLGFVQLQVLLPNNVGAHVRVYVTARDPQQ